jgi:hypothetical protein
VNGIAGPKMAVPSPARRRRRFNGEALSAIADADHFLPDMSSIAGNRAKRPSVLQTGGPEAIATRGIAARTLLAYLV